MGKYEAKFMNQYSSHFDHRTRAHTEIVYREGGKAGLKVYTGLTESGCGITLGRVYHCWCKDEVHRQEQLARERKLQEELEKKRLAVQAIAMRVNRKIQTKAGNVASRWGEKKAD